MLCGCFIKHDANSINVRLAFVLININITVLDIEQLTKMSLQNVLLKQTA